MGNFQAFNWTPERDNWKPATVNEAPTTAQYNDDKFVDQCYREDERHVGRKTWSESKHVRPMCQFSDNVQGASEVGTYDIIFLLKFVVVSRDLQVSEGNVAIVMTVPSNRMTW